MLSVSLTHTLPSTPTLTDKNGFMWLGVGIFPNVNEIFFTFMHIHIDNGKVITVNKNEKHTKIHPQGPRLVLGLSVKAKDAQPLSALLARSPSFLSYEHLYLAFYQIFYKNFPI